MNRMTRLLHPFSALDHLHWSPPPGRFAVRAALVVAAALAVAIVLGIVIQHTGRTRPIPVVPAPVDPVVEATPVAPQLPVVEPTPPMVLRVQGPPLVIRAAIPHRKTPAP
jgi:hypothetical protein